MKPAPFAYEAPATIEEALALLVEHGDEAAVLAGGQSLVPMLNFRLARPRVLVDVNGLSGLDGVSAEDGVLRLGALTRTAAVERHPDVAARWPGVRQALEQVGHPQIRNRGTVGGSVAHADPAAELPAVLVALDGEVVLRSLDGSRVVPAGDFFLGPFTTVRRSNELVTEVRLKTPPRKSTFLEFARRHGDFALVGAFVAVDVEAGRVERARIGLCGASPAPVRARRAEGALGGRALDGEAIADAAQAASEEVDPWDDLHGPAEYRRHLAAVAVRRALTALAGSCS